jgi:hypothetical protein
MRASLGELKRGDRRGQGWPVRGKRVEKNEKRRRERRGEMEKRAEEREKRERGNGSGRERG